MAVLLLLGAIGFGGKADAAQGIAQYGKPKYADGFAHFDYVNPNAPRGGTLTLPNPDRRTSFDKFNPFTLRGVTAPGVSQLMFESLAVGSADEVSSAYGLIAEDIAVAGDKMSVTFRMKVTSYPFFINQRRKISKLTPLRTWPMCGAACTVAPQT
jgi:microcin C transport system substrate-binding protein